jgi:hypothetical protein
MLAPGPTAMGVWMKTSRTGRSLGALALALLAAAPQPAPAAARTPHARLDSAFLIGAWTDDGDCGHAMQFIGNGRFVAAAGGTGSWDLKGNRLTLSGTGIVVVRLIVRGPDRVDVINADGSVGHSTRCPAPREGDAPVASDVT